MHYFYDWGGGCVSYGLLSKVSTSFKLYKNILPPSPKHSGSGEVKSDLLRHRNYSEWGKSSRFTENLWTAFGWAGQLRPFRVWGLSLASFCGGVHSDLVGWWKGALMLISAYVENRNVGPWMCWGPTWVKESPSVLLAKQEPLDYHQDFGLVSRVSSHWPKSATTMGCHLKMERAE